MRPQPNAPTPLTLARAALLALVASTVLVLSTARATRADGCKPDGQRCATNVSCCSRTCMKPAPPWEKRPITWGRSGGRSTKPGWRSGGPPDTRAPGLPGFGKLGWDARFA